MTESFLVLILILVFLLLDSGYCSAGKPPVDIPYDSASLDSANRYSMHLIS